MSDVSMYATAGSTVTSAKPPASICDFQSNLLQMVQALGTQACHIANRIEGPMPEPTNPATPHPSNPDLRSINREIEEAVGYLQRQLARLENNI